MVFPSDFKKKDKEPPKTGWFSFLKKPPYLNLIYISLAINVLSIIIVILLKKHLPPEVPLFYGLAEGEDQLTKNIGLIISPIVSILIVTINLIIASIMNNELLRKTLITIGFCVTIFSLVTLSQIILLVGSF